MLSVGDHHLSENVAKIDGRSVSSNTGEQLAGRIYLLKEDSKLLAMEQAPYDSESLLQKLLADHPDLLAGDQIDAEEPRRWLLVTREMAVPGEQDGAARWSLDHLFLDQDAIPTLVEVKRSSPAGGCV